MRPGYRSRPSTVSLLIIYLLLSHGRCHLRYNNLVIIWFCNSVVSHKVCRISRTLGRTCLPRLLALRTRVVDIIASLSNLAWTSRHKVVILWLLRRPSRRFDRISDSDVGHTLFKVQLIRSSGHVFMLFLNPLAATGHPLLPLHQLIRF